jgi:hypothetical protein
MAVSAPPPPTVEIDDGVIEEARRRRRRRRTAIIAAVLCAAGLGAGLAAGLGGDGPRPIARLPLAKASVRLAYVHGRPYIHGQLFQLVVRPYLSAGSVSLEIDDPAGGGEGGGYPRLGTALFGPGFWQPGPVGGVGGQVAFFFAEPEVAAVRVPGVGVIKPVAVAQLPPGIRAVVFYRPPGSRGTIVPAGMTASELNLGRSNLPAITATPLNSQGQPLPVKPPAPTLGLPKIFWSGGTGVPARGLCQTRSTARDVRIQWGTVATEITPDPSASGPAFFTCLQVWYHTPAGGFQTGVVLNAQHPGARPAPLWGATPVPGHPGLVQVPPIQESWVVPAHRLSPTTISQATARLTRRYGKTKAQQIIRHAIAFRRVPHRYRESLAPRIIARRVGNAWLLVENGTLAEQIAFLNTLTITRLDIPGGH